MFGGLGRPGQRESSQANTETLVSVPAMQYLFAGLICSVVGIGDLFWLVFTLVRAGTRATWLMCMVVISSALFWLYRRLDKVPAIHRWRYYSYVALVVMVAVAVVWILAGEDFVWRNFTLPMQGPLEDLPILLLLSGWIVLGSFSYFALFIAWGWRNDMASKSASGWTATRNQIPGNTEPELPGVKFAPMTTQPEANRTTLLKEYANEQSWDLPDGTRVSMFELLTFLRASEVGNRGLTREVAEACGMRRTTQKKVVARLQELGLATENGQGVVARLVKGSDLVMRDLGFAIEDDGEAEIGSE